MPEAEPVVTVEDDTIKITWYLPNHWGLRLLIDQLDYSEPMAVVIMQLDSSLGKYRSIYALSVPKSYMNKRQHEGLLSRVAGVNEPEYDNSIHTWRVGTLISAYIQGLNLWD